MHGRVPLSLHHFLVSVFTWTVTVLHLQVLHSSLREPALCEVRCLCLTAKREPFQEWGKQATALSLYRDSAEGQARLSTGSAASLPTVRIHDPLQRPPENLW